MKMPKQIMGRVARRECVIGTNRIWSGVIEEVLTLATSDPSAASIITVAANPNLVHQTVTAPSIKKPEERKLHKVTRDSDGAALIEVHCDCGKVTVVRCAGLKGNSLADRP
jgi:hypothetical protein